MREITITNLLQLEPRLTWEAASDGASIAAHGRDDREISWAVSVRSNPPHLPALRGGELLLLSKSAVEGVGGEMAALLREAANRGVSALVVGSEAAFPPGLARDAPETPVFIWDGPVAAETESGLNRLLTQTRGELYRVGSELERRMANATLHGLGLDALASEIGDVIGAPAGLHDFGKAATASAIPPFLPFSRVNGPGQPSFVEIAVTDGIRFDVGPASASSIIAATVFRDRIAAALADALHRERAARPRGEQHEATLAALVKGNVGDDLATRAMARSLGLDAAGQFLVILASDQIAFDLNQQFSPLGTVYAAGSERGRTRYVVALSARSEPEQVRWRVEETAQRLRNGGADSGPQLSLSPVVAGVEHVPRAAADASLLAALQSRWSWLPAVAAFDAAADVGPLDLLESLRESGRLQPFVAGSLGGLLRDDRRGTLRQTLVCYLENGGSQVEAAARLHIHRNTLAYRLRRASELIGRDVTDPRSWLTLHLSLLGADLIEITSAGNENRKEPW